MLLLVGNGFFFNVCRYLPYIGTYILFQVGRRSFTRILSNELSDGKFILVGTFDFLNYCFPMHT